MHFLCEFHPRGKKKLFSQVELIKGELGHKGQFSSANLTAWGGGEGGGGERTGKGRGGGVKEELQLDEEGAR